MAEELPGPGLGKPWPRGLALPHLSLNPLPLLGSHCLQMPHTLSRLLRGGDPWTGQGLRWGKAVCVQPYWGCVCCAVPALGLPCPWWWGRAAAVLMSHSMASPAHKKVAAG